MANKYYYYYEPYKKIINTNLVSFTEMYHFLISQISSFDVYCNASEQYFPEFPSASALIVSVGSFLLIVSTSFYNFYK